MPRLDEPRPIPRLAERRHQAVNAIARIAVNACDPPFGQPLNHKIADGVSHKALRCADDPQSVRHGGGAEPLRSLCASVTYRFCERVCELLLVVGTNRAG